MSEPRFAWSCVPLTELCDIQIGRTPERAVPQYWGPGYPWLSITDMEQGKNLISTKETITQRAVDECRCRLIQPGTLLMSFKLSIGKLGFARIPMYTNEAIAALSVRDETRVLPDYLYYALQIVDLLGSTDRAAMGRTLNTDKLERIPIPLPLLSEQKRIAAVLDKADRLRRLRRYALELGDTYLQSVFLEMFGDPMMNPKGWEVAPVEKVLSKTRTGIQTGPFGSSLKRNEYVSEGIPVWGINNMMDNEFVEEGPLFITPEKYRELTNYSVESGDILVSRAGTVGRMCVARPTTSPSIIGTNLIRIALDTTLMLPEYFTALFTYFGSQVGHLKMSSDEDAYSFINPRVLKTLEIQLPLLDAQTRFVSIVHKHVRLRAQQREAERQAEHLFQSLLHRAFAGNCRL